MTEREPGPWFPARRYGWGWGPPRSWQGWLVVLVYALVIVGGLLLYDGPDDHARLLLLIGGATAALTGVCWWKGESPRWRWGRDDPP